MSSVAFLASSREEIARRMEKVIEVEGPVVDDLLQKRVLRSYGLLKRGNQIQALLDSVMASLPEQHTIQISSDGKEHAVYWPEGMEEATYTSFRAPGKRDITEYPVVEVANIIASLPQSKKNDLYLATVEVLGFKRKGANIKKTFALAYRYCKSEKSQVER